MKKKIISAITAFLLAATLLLSGCSEQQNTPYQSADTSSDSGIPTDPESSVSENVSTDEPQSSTSGDHENSTSGSGQSSDSTEFAEFTEEDKELQAILKDIEGGVNLIINWCECGPFMASGGSLLAPAVKFKFPQSDKPDSVYEYYLIPDNYSREGDVTMPTTRADMMDLMLDYFTESYIDQRYNIDAGTMKENSDGTFSVVFDEIRNTYGGHFIEVNGRLYRYGSEGCRTHLTAETARVTHKTDDLIEFTFVGYNYPVEDPRFKFKASGRLKLERGGWKLDQLSPV